MNEFKQFSVSFPDELQVQIKAALQTRSNLIYCGFLMKQGNVIDRTADSVTYQ